MSQIMKPEILKFSLLPRLVEGPEKVPRIDSSSSLTEKHIVCAYRLYLASCNKDVHILLIERKSVLTPNEGFVAE